MFGEYDFPFTYETEDLALSIEGEGNFFTYKRRCRGDEVTKILGTTQGKVVISPVEPINLPQEITPYLEIRFTPVACEPDSVQTLYLTFPIEIGVFLEARGTYDVLDIFTLTSPKYSLYGTPVEGIITRYHESGVSPGIPPTDLLQEGLLSLTIRNSSRGWVEVSRVVMDCSGFVLFCGDMVTLTARMEILSRDLADVRIGDKPLCEGMFPATLLARARMRFIPETLPFMMEYGVGV
ncbi:MAG: DUF432 domain-containing protein [Methanoregulaceae archaeon]|jgi:hypothetical protein